jgi:hypothetical protein
MPAAYKSLNESSSGTTAEVELVDISLAAAAAKRDAAAVDTTSVFGKQAHKAGAKYVSFRSRVSGKQALDENCIQYTVLLQQAANADNLHDGLSDALRCCCTFTRNIAALYDAAWLHRERFIGQMSWTPLEAVLMLLIACTLASNARHHYAAGITKAMGLLMFMVPKNRCYSNQRMFLAVVFESNLSACSR